MRLDRILFVFMALPYLLFCHFASVLAQPSGTIVYSDTAPPPTEQEIQAAKSYGARAAYLADTIPRLGTVMAAMKELIGAFDGPAGTDDSDWVSAGGSWRTSLTKLLPSVAEGQPTVLADSEIGNFVKQTLMLAGKIKSAIAEARPSDLRDLADAFLNKQSIIIDQMLAEHGQLNREIRYYPMSAIVKQASLGCDQIASLSRDFRCYPKTANPSLPAGQWCDITHSAQSFSVTEWASGTVMVVRMASFADHTLGGGLAGELIGNAHTAASLQPKC